MKPKKRNIQKDILFVLISSFVVVAAWVGFNLYHISVTSTISPEVQAKLIPIDPSFDTATIQNLKSREKIVPAFDHPQIASQSSIEPTPEPTTLIEADSSRFAPTNAPINRTGQ